VRRVASLLRSAQNGRRRRIRGRESGNADSARRRISLLTQNLGQAFDLALETKNPAYPQIHPFCTATRKLGGDVTDFTYRQAWIDRQHAYRITGTRGAARWLNVAKA
jgi:hypothetical protein